MKPAGQNKRTTVIGSKVKVNKEVKEKRTKSRQSNAKTSRKNPKTSEKKKCIQLLQGTEAPSCQKPPLLPQNDKETNYVEIRTEMSIPQQGIPSNTVAKLALQLFPMDDVTRNVLEKDKHNPHIELTMGVRKKISSVVKHLITKWKISSVPVGELMLFPYEPQLNNDNGFERWNVENTGICAGDIHKMLGSPSVFRLRYGWFPNNDQNPNKESQSIDIGRERQLEAIVNNSPSNDRALEEPVDLKENKNTDMLFVNEMSNISLSEIFSEIPTINMNSNQNMPLPTEGSSRLLYNFDSLDVAIASFKNQSIQISNTSIWDDDETCHAFSLQKNCGLLEDSSIPKEPFQVKGSGCDEPLSKIDTDLVNPESLSQECHPNLFEQTEPHIITEGEEYKTGILLSEEGDSQHGSKPHKEDLVTANGNDMGLSSINFDSLGPMEFGVSLSPLCKQIYGEESIDFNTLFGFGNSRDASTSCS